MQDKQKNSRQASGATPQAGRSPSPLRLRPSAFPQGFTLTELLIVIAIIAVLAALITAAAVNALRAANRGRISLAIQGLSRAAEDFKNEYGAYPPNGMNNEANPSLGLVAGDFQRMFKKAFPRHQEPPVLIAALCGNNTGGTTNENLINGMTAAEAVYFWFGGFSSDPQFPISGPGGPSYLLGPGGPGEVLEDRNINFEFELTQLGPRDDDGVFLEGPVDGRFIVYEITINGDTQERRINLWQYSPKNSQQPIVYFDTSRHKPNQYDPPGSVVPNSDLLDVFALKKVREGLTVAANPEDVAFIDNKKFQLLHAGLDDEWGAFGPSESSSAGSIDTVYFFPDGPFIGPIADTLTNFTDGALEDAAE